MAVILRSRAQAFPGFQFMIYCLIMLSLLLKSVETVNCSEPTTNSLLSALNASIFGRTEIRPVFNLNTPTNISVTFILFGILGVDEKGQKLKTFLWVDLMWNIEGLSWDPVECGTDRISLPRKKLWMPDIVINQFVDENKVPDTYYLYVTHDGRAIDSIPVHVISSCNLDIYTFPFDIQNCTFTFNSYQHSVLDIQLFFADSVEYVFKKSLSVMSTRGEWELVDMRADKPTIPPGDKSNAYDTLNYYIVLKRRASLYIVNLLIPSCFLIAVDLFSFLLPPQETDRSTFKMTLILGYTVFLLLMNDLLPVTGNTLPLLNVFFSLCLILMVASLIETIIMTNIMCGSSNYGPLPQWMKVLFLKYLAKLVCLSRSDQNCDHDDYRTQSRSFDPVVKIPETEDIHNMPPTLHKLKKISHDLLSIRQQVEKHYDTDQGTDEWVLLGQIIDRLLFGMYTIFLVFSFFTILVFWVIWYNMSAALV
ncbi:5-hydroxytryptamine receptor 3C [Misgurnus anguillicaudatus]|uniref:5-hydroxytryptamine receptor 3C n=1 Tax=Misgurnus anguillicaudatus TaxID=75329 RepID=UPI003CCF2683